MCMHVHVRTTEKIIIFTIFIYNYNTNTYILGGHYAHKYIHEWNILEFMSAGAGTNKEHTK